MESISVKEKKKRGFLKAQTMPVERKKRNPRNIV